MWLGGKIMLAGSFLNKTVDMSQGLEGDIAMCLMCGSCMHKCPNHVPTQEIVGAMRREITSQKGLSATGKAVSTLLGHRALMKAGAKVGAFFSPLFLHKVPHSSGLRLRFPLSFMRGRTFPGVRFRNLFDRVPVHTKGEPGKETLAFFAGCAITYLYPEIGEKMITILRGLGYSVSVPRKQKCCGIPALSAGAGTTFEELADNNMKAFEDYGAGRVITACGSCNGGLKEYESVLKGGSSGFAEKVMDFSVFLEKERLAERLAAMEKWQNVKRVTYHDPCHLKTQGVTVEPRNLLRALPNVDFVEMKNGALCCGLGGTFSVYHYEMSKAIGVVKTEGILDSGAEIVATTCPGCIIQLQDVINHAGLDVRVVHLLDLIAAALERDGEGCR